jgi:hypothetical protein
VRGDGEAGGQRGESEVSGVEDEGVHRRRKGGRTVDGGAIRYQAGTLADEIAALLSLCYGIRLKSGGPTRWFSRKFLRSASVTVV